jgi:hypothetical protein
MVNLAVCERNSAPVQVKERSSMIGDPNRNQPVLGLVGCSDAIAAEQFRAEGSSNA